MKHFISVTLLVVLLSSCAPSAPVPTPAASLSPTITLAPTLTPTLTMTPTFTPTYTPTITPSLTPSLTPTHTATPTFAWTPLPTLSSTEENVTYFQNLVRTNGDCALPCFLGVEVGNSTWQNVEHIFRPLTDEIIPKTQDSLLWFEYQLDLPNRDYIQVFSVELGGSLQSTWPPRVEEIDARFYLESFFVPYNYRLAAIKAFSLPYTLEELGVPSSVYIYGPEQYEKDDFASASLILIYQEAGFSIEYSLVSPYINPVYDDDSFCFLPDWIEVMHFQIVLSENGRSLVSRLSEEYNFLNRSDLTLEEFYEIGISDPAPCFEVND